jgi:hypothetical protein
MTDDFLFERLREQVREDRKSSPGTQSDLPLAQIQTAARLRVNPRNRSARWFAGSAAGSGLALAAGITLWLGKTPPVALEYDVELKSGAQDQRSGPIEGAAAAPRLSPSTAPQEITLSASNTNVEIVLRPRQTFGKVNAGAFVRNRDAWTTAAGRLETAKAGAVRFQTTNDALRGSTQFCILVTSQSIPQGHALVAALDDTKAPRGTWKSCYIIR